MRFNLRKASLDNNSKSEYYKKWDREIINFLRTDNLNGLKDYLNSKDKVEDKDFFIFLYGNSVHYLMFINDLGNREEFINILEGI